MFTRLSENDDTYLYSVDSNDKKVGVIYGHFAPFTGPNGHGRMLSALEKLGCEKFIIAVPQNKSRDKDRNIVDYDTRLETVKEGASEVTDKEVRVVTVPISSRPNVPAKVIPKLVEQYGLNVRPIFCVGPDRVGIIKNCVSYDKDNYAGKNSLTLASGSSTDKCESILLEDRGKYNLSGSVCRQLIFNKDSEQLSKLTGYSKEFVDKLIKTFNS